ncbi:DOMON-like domain-containing protein [Hydrogenophaga sp.]|uniref:DOMON-like domain-containing protein n=1 Tax=Hydrogenophaga sp. TaxID=1904254 RepID=UPI0027302DE8|nr:DOMON-like domain-containing protein [Hydrogenophaga sp.]MDP2073749.1 DOMON-like domain-containing protein [Hydrogenophaga sp.]MDP3106873.1 DOMON-like domain-containing protein [Hydrogenophaga sp.]
MTPTPSRPTHALHCHPATPPGLPLDVSVSAGWTAESLQLVYAIAGNIGALRVPAPTRPGPADGLWQHTCLEAFVSAEGDVAYREFNFSPSGQWAAYRFASERQRDTTTALELPVPAMHRAFTPTLLTLDVHLPLAALPSSAVHLELALCAVIEEQDGRLSYWALQHPCERPDFHHPAARSLRLALPQN